MYRGTYYTTIKNSRLTLPKNWLAQLTSNDTNCWMIHKPAFSSEKWGYGYELGSVMSMSKFLETFDDAGGLIYPSDIFSFYSVVLTEHGLQIPEQLNIDQNVDFCLLGCGHSFIVWEINAWERFKKEQEEQDIDMPYEFGGYEL